MPVLTVRKTDDGYRASDGIETQTGDNLFVNGSRLAADDMHVDIEVSDWDKDRDGIQIYTQ